MNLIKEDIDTIKHLGYPKKVDLSIGSYYIKKVKEKQIVRELLGSKLALEFNLITPQYKVLMIDNEYYLLSEDLNNLGEFKIAKKIGITDFINSSIYQISLYLKLNQMFNKSLELELVSLYLYDILLGNFDRHNSNWGFINVNNNLHLGILDNETILDEDYLNKEPYYKHFEGITAYKGYIKTTIEDIDLFMKDNFIAFMENYPEYRNIVNELITKLTPEYLNDLLKSIEDETLIYTPNKKIPLKISNKEELTKIYQYGYQLIQDIEREYNHAR